MDILAEWHYFIPDDEPPHDVWERLIERVCANCTRPESTIGVLSAGIGRLYALADKANPLGGPQLRLFRRRFIADKTLRPLHHTPLVDIPTIVAHCKAKLTSMTGADPATTRAAAILLLATSLPVRPSDIAWLMIEDIEFDQPQLGSASVTFRNTKTDSRRRGQPVPLHPSPDPVVCPVRHLRETIGDRRSGRVFTQLHALAPLAPATVSAIIRRAFDECGIVGQARSLRTSVSTALLEADIPVNTVMRLGRWRRPETFQFHYDARAVPRNVTELLQQGGVRRR